MRPMLAARSQLWPPLLAGAIVGALTYLVLHLLPGTLLDLAWLCTGCGATDLGDVVTAATVGGPTVGTYAAKSTFENLVGRFFGSSGPVPIFKVKKIIDIGSAETDEEAHLRAMEAYKDLIMIKDAPPGSPGGDILEAMDAFSEFATGETEIGPDDDDP